MADISKELQVWREAVYGKDVREAEIILNEKMNAEVEAGTARIEEYGRKEAERNAAEQSRSTAEACRVTEESIRKQNETARSTAETSRNESESVRVTEEGTRKQNEAERSTAEQSRSITETERANSEAERVSVEAGRVSAESERGAKFNVLKAASETATDNANTAATNANGKATVASSAAVAANDAADRANAAAQSAEDVVAGKGMVLAAEKGAANGVATLDDDEKVPLSQLGNATAALVGLGNVPNLATNDQMPTFAQASTRENIESGEKVSILFGKIQKWFADLKSVAFSGSYNDLSDRPALGGSASQAVANNLTINEAGSVLDARQGVVIADSLNTLNNNLETHKALAYSGKLPVLNDTLFIDTTNPYADINMTKYRLYTGSGTTNMPPGCTLGIREFLHFNDNWFVLKITELSPQLGRTWYRRYDRAISQWDAAWEDNVNINMTYKGYNASSITSKATSSALIVRANAYECKCNGFLQLSTNDYAHNEILFKLPFKPIAAIYFPTSISGKAFYVNGSGEVVNNGVLTLSSSTYVYLSFNFAIGV